jgi:hypothetical protein
MCKVTDIKAGQIDEWNLCSTDDYSQERELDRATKLYTSGIISKDELLDVEERLKPTLTLVELLRVRKDLRFGLLRWTTEDVARGKLTLRDGREYTLFQAFQTKGITKVDVIAWTGDTYAEVSNLILWTNKAGHTYATMEPLEKGLRESLAVYADEGNWVKVLKRLYSLGKALRHENIQSDCLRVLNGKVGYMYALTADFEILHTLRELTNLTSVEQANIRSELDALRDRLAHILTPHFMTPQRPTPDLFPLLYRDLQQLCHKEMLTAHLLPLPSFALPPSPRRH